MHIHPQLPSYVFPLSFPVCQHIPAKPTLPLSCTIRLQARFVFSFLLNLLFSRSLSLLLKEGLKSKGGETFPSVLLQMAFFHSFILMSDPSFYKCVHILGQRKTNIIWEHICLEKEMAVHSSALAWRIPETVGFPSCQMVKNLPVTQETGV